VKPGREGPTAPFQLHGGLQSPNMTVTPVGTTTIHMAETPSAQTMPPTPHRLHYLRSSARSKRLAFEGSSNSLHIGSHNTRLILKHGTV
jgi:hypothetical protein